MPSRSLSARKKNTYPTAYISRVPAVCEPPLSTRRWPIRSATPSQNAADLRLSHVAPESRISMPASSFSQMRGTPNSTVGCTSRRLAGTVSIDSAKFTWVAAAALNHVLKIRSATCASGR